MGSLWETRLSLNNSNTVKAPPTLNFSLKQLKIGKTFRWRKSPDSLQSENCYHLPENRRTERKYSDALIPPAAFCVYDMSLLILEVPKDFKSNEVNWNKIFCCLLSSCRILYQPERSHMLLIITVFINSLQKSLCPLLYIYFLRFLWDGVKVQ